MPRRERSKAQQQAMQKQARGQGVSVGFTGLSGWGSGLGIYDQLLENVDRLRGPLAMQIWARMRNHSRVAAVLRSYELPVRRATWTVEPPPEPKKIEEQRAKFLNAAYFQYMDTPWDDVISAAMLMLPFGFTLLENTVRVDEKNNWVPRTMELRQQYSIVDARVVDGQPRAFRQQTVNGQRDIQRKYCSLFTNGVLNGWSGESILRPAYAAWFMSDLLMRILGVAHERWSAGIPVVEHPNNASDTEIERIEQDMEDLGADERSYLRLVEGFIVKMLEGMRRPMDPLEAIKYFDDEIARTALAQHLTLGGSASGSRALGVAFLNSFVEGLQAYADHIADVITRDSLTILCISNWGDTDRNRQYRIRVSDVHGSLLRDLAFASQSGLLDRGDPDVNDFIKRRVGIPITGRPSRQTVAAGGGGDSGGGSGGGTDNENNGSEGNENQTPENKLIEVIGEMRVAGFTSEQLQEFVHENY